MKTVSEITNWQEMIGEVIHGDCLKLMKKIPDKVVDLVLTDPPYGIGFENPTEKKKAIKQRNGSYLSVAPTKYTRKNWDTLVPRSYFDEIKRISKAQIIFGVNYFDYDFRGGRIVWDKLNDGSDQYDCEIAYNSLNIRTDIVRFKWAGMIQGVSADRNYEIANKQQGNKKKNEKRFHPTQKPVELFRWILQNYSKDGDLIFDGFAGSFTTARACKDMGRRWICCDLEKEYCRIGEERLRQQLLF